MSLLQIAFIKADDEVEVFFNQREAPDKKDVRKCIDALLDYLDTPQKEIDKYNEEIRQYWEQQLADSYLPRKKNKEPQAGWIYLYQMGEYYKIGATRDPRSRRSAYRSSSPYEILTVFEVWDENYKDTEKNLHTELAPYRHRGEWYGLPQEILNNLLERYAG